MFLFSFPLFGEKGECKQEFRHAKKNTRPQAEKTRAGNFWDMRTCAWLFSKKMRDCIAHVIALHACICEHGCVVCVCVLALLPLAHADQWTEGSFLCGSLGSLRFDGQ